MSDRDNQIAQFLLATARAAGWRHSTAIWDYQPESVVFSFVPPGQLPFAIAVKIDPTLWEADTSPAARLKVAGDAITAAQSTAALDGLDPTGPSRAEITTAQD